MDVALNWLIQGAVVAIAAAAGLRLIPASRAQARYGFVWAAVLLLLALPAVPAVVAVGLGPATVDLGAAATGPVVTIPAAWWTSPAVAIALWMCWSSLQAVRLGLGALAVRDARRRGRECPADVLAHLPRWSERCLTGRATRVIISSRVRVAAVLGCGRPTIALAPNLVNDLSVDDLERVLIHEWAHVQRRDDLAQLIQHLVRIVVGWHPASWWLERQLEFEREAACDEVAVSVTGSAKGYAACLATVAALPGPARFRSLPALAAASPYRLRARLVRILAAPRVDRSRPWRAMTVCGGSALLGCTLAVGNLPLVALIATPAVVSEAPRPPDAAIVVRPLSSTSPSTERTGPAARAVGRRESRQEPSPAMRKEAPAPAMTLVPTRVSAGLLEASLSLPPAIPSTETLVDVTGETQAAPLAVSEPLATEAARAPWTQAADMGAGIGRASHRAGTATAGFFTRFGKKLAGSF